LAGITAKPNPPVFGNDWNDTLTEMQKAARTQNKTRHSDTLCL